MASLIYFTGDWYFLQLPGRHDIALSGGDFGRMGWRKNHRYGPLHTLFLLNSYQCFLWFVLDQQENGMGYSEYYWGSWRGFKRNRGKVLKWCFFILVNLCRCYSKDYIIKDPNAISL